MIICFIGVNFGYDENMNGRLKKSLNILMMLLLVSVFLVSCTEKQNNTYLSISQNEAMKLMEEEENYVILDVRREDEFVEGHIPGAICIPNESIIEEAEGILKDKDQLILVYCRSGNRSKQASRKLADLGYTRIREFGGIIDWKGEIEK